MPLVNPTTMWRKDVADKIGMYHDGEFPEDYEMWLRWLNVGVQMQKLNKRLLKWFDSDERLTRTDGIYSDSAFYKIKTACQIEMWHQIICNNPPKHYPC